MKLRLSLFILVPVLASAAPRPVTKECAPVIKACQAGGFVYGPKNTHGGQGLWAGCVRPISRGRGVVGVKGVSKNAALTCLKTRRPIK